MKSGNYTRLNVAPFGVQPQRAGECSGPRFGIQQVEGAVVDRSVLQAGENSPEHVAYRLMECIADVEGISLSKSGKEKMATRKWILDAYAESLDAVRANRRYNKPQT
ncbi:MAG: hypothetical protein Q8M13_04090 [Phenylobacterium sp.]|nr:hypothetical protein [Phenylobacterium sp.]